MNTTTATKPLNQIIIIPKEVEALPDDKFMKVMSLAATDVYMCLAGHIDAGHTDDEIILALCNDGSNPTAMRLAKRMLTPMRQWWNARQKAGQ